MTRRTWIPLFTAVAIALPLCLSQEASKNRAETPTKLDLRLPNKPQSLKFAVLGDTGTGDRDQYEIGALAAQYHKVYPFTFVLLVGDNMYRGEKPKDFKEDFEEPYKDLLAADVKFYASLGNHDNPNQRFYKQFNMNGERYYTFKPRDGVRFFALDSTYMSPDQLQWLEKELRNSGSDWKIVFFHHPLYSSGETHGPSMDLRKVLEPVFLKSGVNVVFNGHEHFYERVKPQSGIYYFIEGASGKLRRGNIRKTDETEKGFDQDNTFMLVEIDGDKLHFQAITRKGQVIDAGAIDRPQPKEEKPKQANSGGAAAAESPAKAAVAANGK